ncbi:MAG: polyphosphate kinase 2 family protein [Solirubrobacterales bacterium]|nr:polyphosphate kinase 2 family protein [Solirubrobacterales bacterium]
MAKAKLSTGSVAEEVRVGPGFQLADLEASSTPGFAGNKKSAAKAMAATADEMSELQERLYANGRDGSGPAVLLIVQGMDTSGKGGIMRHIVGRVDPQGVKLTAFKTPTEEELAHPFLWRVENALPTPGYIGVFDRSQYEDVLVVRVHNYVPRTTWSRRYAQINRFEKRVADSGTKIIKVMLHISPQEQKARLAERLARKDKHWKFNPNDVVEREHWAEYMDAYQAIFDKTNTEAAPWHVVPADKKWFARFAVNHLLLEELRACRLSWPKAEFDVKAEQKRLART